MITDSLAILLILVSVPAILYTINSTKAGARFFSVFPILCLAYFIPMALSNLEVIPRAEGPVFDVIRLYITPLCLIYLVMAADIKAVLGLGPKPVVVFLSSTLGVMVGCLVSYFLFRNFLPPDAWKAMSAISAAWIGGAANMLAVGSALGVDDAAMGMAAVVDVVVGSSWMALMLFVATRSERFDKWTGADTSSLEVLKEKSIALENSITRPTTLTDFLQLGALGILGLFLAFSIPNPKIGGQAYFDAATWRILIATTYGVLLSFTRLRKLEGAGASKIGTALIFLLIGRVGAGADFHQMLDYPWLVVAGLIWILIQAVFVYAAMRLTRSPLLYGAVGSQANIGGTASAPLVAAAFHPGFATVGLLLAILGNVLGTYGALLISPILKAMAPV